MVGAEPEWITRLRPRLPPDASSLDDAVAHSAHVKQDRVLISAVGQALVVAGQDVHTATFGENIRPPLLWFLAAFEFFLLPREVSAHHHVKHVQIVANDLHSCLLRAKQCRLERVRIRYLKGGNRLTRLSLRWHGMLGLGKSVLCAIQDFPPYISLHWQRWCDLLRFKGEVVRRGEGEHTTRLDPSTLIFVGHRRVLRGRNLLALAKLGSPVVAAGRLLLDVRRLVHFRAVSEHFFSVPTLYRLYFRLSFLNYQ